MSTFINSTFVKQMCDITKRAYDHFWDERNGGNISYRIDDKALGKYDDIGSVIKNIPIDFDAKPLIGQYYLVTGTGRYFKNVQDFPERDMGLVRIAQNGHSVELIWGFNDGGRPTSEFPSHLMTHIKRQRIDDKQRCVIHCHPTNLIAMTFTLPLDEKRISRILWKMQAESIVVFPEGVGIVPYMTPGTNAIAVATARKMERFRAVLWPHHGIFASGETLDETFGLIETIEKAALIYTTIKAQGGEVVQSITDKDLVALAERFSIHPNKEFLCYKNRN